MAAFAVHHTSPAVAGTTAIVLGSHHSLLDAAEELADGMGRCTAVAVATVNTAAEVIVVSPSRRFFVFWLTSVHLGHMLTAGNQCLRLPGTPSSYA